jgi:hypothetical protein
VVPHTKTNSDSNHRRVRGKRVTAQARMRESRGDLARTRAAPSAWVGQAACAAGPSRAHKAMGWIAAQYCTSFSFFLKSISKLNFHKFNQGSKIHRK